MKVAESLKTMIRLLDQIITAQKEFEAHRPEWMEYEIEKERLENAIKVLRKYKDLF